MESVIRAAAIYGLLLVVFRYYLPSALDKGLSGTSFAWPTRATIGLGLLCFLGLMAEGSVIDWGVSTTSKPSLFGSFAATSTDRA